MKVAPLKGRRRAEEKARDKYSSREPGPACSWLYDVVRASVLCDTPHALELALRNLERQPGLCIVTFDNRFRNPTPAGFRDINVAVRLRCGVVCEVQHHLRVVKEFDEANDSHSHFEYFRTYFAGSMQAVESRLGDLRVIVEAAADDKDGSSREGEDGASVLDDAFMMRLMASDDQQQLLRVADLLESNLSEFELAQRLKVRAEQLARLGHRQQLLSHAQAGRCSC